jgi:hypothetical protein
MKKNLDYGNKMLKKIPTNTIESTAAEYVGTRLEQRYRKTKQGQIAVAEK